MTKLPVSFIMLFILVAAVFLASVAQLPLMAIIGIFIPEERSSIPFIWVIATIIALVGFVAFWIIWARKVK